MAGLTRLKIKPKELKQVPSGRIFGYTEALAKRSDMVPIWPDGVDPNFVGEPKTPEQVKESRSGQYREELKAKDIIIQSLNNQIKDLAEEIDSLNAEIVKLRTLSEADNPDTGVPNDPEFDAPADGEATTDERMANIKAAAALIMEKQDQNDFTGQGKIRIGPLEEITGYEDITATERDAAMEG